jgi:hypothetical protein
MKSDRATVIRQHLFDRCHSSIAEIAFAQRERINLPLKRAIRGAARTRAWSDCLFLGPGAIDDDGCLPGMDKQEAGLNTLMLGMTSADAP